MDPINPWVSIWKRPRATILQVASEDPKRGLWMLAAIYGFLSLLNVFQAVALGYFVSLFPILFLAIVFSPLWGYLIFNVWGGIVYGVGKLLGGKAPFPLIRAAYGWSCVPFIISIFVWTILLSVFGVSLFQNFPENYLVNDKEIVLLFASLIVKVAISIWSLVIFINALSEVQQFSTVKSILNIVFSWVVLVLGVWLFWQFLGYLHMA